jgi:glyoxylase-like metal-dependent hydrolase (beta-lactamase superfamily II)
VEIIPNLQRVPGVIGAAYLITDGDGLTLIDTGMRGSQRRILGALRRLGYPAAALRRILITHADGDHVGAAAALVAACGAVVYASATEAAALATGRPSRDIRLRGGWRLLYGLIRPFLSIPPLPGAQVVREGDRLPGLGGLVVIETPGHTPGHLSFYAPTAGVLFAGDSIAFRNGRMRRPFTLLATGP